MPQGPFQDFVRAYPSLLQWYDASQVAGVADGGTITALGDMSGNGWTLTPVSTGPTYRATGHNGLPTIEFNGNPLGASAQVLPLTNFTIIVVMYVWTTGRPFGWEHDGSGTHGLGFYFSGSPQWVYRNSGSTYDFSISFTISIPVILTLRTHSFLASKSTAAQSSTINTSSQTSATAWSSAGQNFKMGSSGNAGAGSMFVGKISEFLTFNRALDDTELAKFRALLSRKWGNVYSPVTQDVLGYVAIPFGVPVEPLAGFVQLERR
jgi:hypothetical protein